MISFDDDLVTLKYVYSLLCIVLREMFEVMILKEQRAQMCECCGC